MLDEWCEGWRRPLKFYMNLYADAYNQHLSRLRDIKDADETKYNALLRRLFRLARYVHNVIALCAT